MKRFLLVIAALLLFAGTAFAAATDTFSKYSSVLDSPARHAFTVTPHDTNELANVTRGIYVGGAGNIVLITSGGETVTFVGLPAGTLLPVCAKTIKSTSTTATYMLGLY